MDADLVLKTTALFTSTQNASHPGAVAIADGSILAVCAYDEADAFIGPRTRMLDLGDAFVCPGFHDSHLHFTSSAIGRSFPIIIVTGARLRRRQAKRRIPPS